MFSSQFIFSLLIYFFCCYVFSFLMIKFRREAFFVTLLMTAIFPFVADSTDWDNWFIWAKRFSVMFPVIIYSLLKWRLNLQNRYWQIFFTWVLFINMAEAAILDIQWENYLNGSLLLIVSLFTPVIMYRNGVIGFRNGFWIVAKVFTLTCLYLFNPTVENTTVPAIMILLIAAIGLFHLGRDYWLAFRVYSLYFLLFVDSIFIDFADNLYPLFIHPENRAIWRDSPIEYVLLLGCLVTVACLINDQHKRYRRGVNETVLNWLVARLYRKIGDKG